MNQCDYYRMGKQIIDSVTSSKVTLPSINKAKQESRRLQAAGKKVLTIPVRAESTMQVNPKFDKRIKRRR
jgi:hypothetical protein